MTTETVAGIDFQIAKQRWALWQARWDVNLDQAEAAMVAIDALLDRRIELVPTTGASSTILPEAA